MASLGLEQQLNNHVVSVDPEVPRRALAEMGDHDLGTGSRCASIICDTLTPLTVILDYLAFLEEGIGGKLSDPQRLYVGEVRARAEEVRLLVRAYLDLVMLERNGLEAATCATDALQVVSAVADSFTSLVKRRFIAMTIECPTELPEVKADPRLLESILMILITNSLKLTPVEGTIVLAIRKHPGHLEFAVRDDGIGLSPRSLAELDDSETRGCPPSGLRLIKQLIANQGGTVVIDSDLGEGMAFTFTLPIA